MSEKSSLTPGRIIALFFLLLAAFIAWASLRISNNIDDSPGPKREIGPLDEMMEGPMYERYKNRSS